MDFIKLVENDVPGAKLSKLPTDSSVQELQRWLECRGLKKTGLKKDLVKRVDDALNADIPLPIDPKIDGGKWYETKRAAVTNEKTEAISNDDIIAQNTLPLVVQSPSICSGRQYTVFPSVNIPELFNAGHLYHYLVEQPSKMVLTDDEPMDDDETARPLRKGKNIFTSGFVHDVGNAEDDHHYFLRGFVHHSMKSEPPVLSTVSLSKLSGYISQASCTCKVKTYERCAHIAALLYFLLDYIEKNGSTVKVPSTSLPCSWNKGKKREKNPQALHNAVYSTQKQDPSKVYKWDPRPLSYRGVDTNLMNEFITSIESPGPNPSSMWETLLKRQYDDFDLNEEEELILKKQCDVFERYLREETALICGTKVATQVTTGQSESQEWFSARRFIITASDSKRAKTFGEKMSKNCDIPLGLISFIRNKLWEEKQYTSADMLYGIQQEPVARSKYEEVTNSSVKTCGLFVNSSYPFLGASPDGIVLNGETEVGLIEIKCLKIFREKSVNEVIKLASTNKTILPNCLELVSGKLALKTTHSYYFQIQHQLLVTKLSFCDFVLHSPIGPPNIERIFPEQYIHTELIEHIYNFWKNTFLPEYFMMKLPRGLKPVVLRTFTCTSTAESSPNNMQHKPSVKQSETD
jgi:hypothetical protein